MGLSAVLVTSVLAAGCSSDLHKLTEAGGGSGIAGMLRMVPASAAASDVFVNRYRAAARAAHIAAPRAGAGADALAHYFGQLTIKTGVEGSDLTQQLGQYGAKARSQNGFDLSAIDSDAESQAPPKVLIAATGRFDLTAVDHALRTGPWKSLLTTPKYDGTTVYRWLDDNKTDVGRANTGLLTSLGNSRRFALPDDHTFLYARTDEGIHGLLDATYGNGKTLADVPAFAKAAAALDAKGVYSADFLGSGPPPLSALLGRLPKAALAALRARLQKYALAPYQLAAIGVARVHGAPTMVTVIVNTDHDAAQTNAKKLRAIATTGSSLAANRPWSDLLAVDDIHADGSLTVGSFREKVGPTAWSHIPQDSLLLHR